MIINFHSFLTTLTTTSKFSICSTASVLFFALLFYNYWVGAAGLWRIQRKIVPSRLRGPPKRSLIFGGAKDIYTASDPGAVDREWEKEYGLVYEIPPSVLGIRSLVLSDPKAVSHVFSKDTTTYHEPNNMRFIFGGTLLAMEGDAHKRQRRAMASAFSTSAIRRLTPVFLDCAYKLKGSWDALLQSAQKESGVIEVQQWMNYTTLDNIGNAGFSHDFGALDGRDSPVKAALDSFSNIKSSLHILMAVLLGTKFPWLHNIIPSKRQKTMQGFNESIENISHALLEKAAREKEARDSVGEIDQSIIGALIRSESAMSNRNMSKGEITAQNLLIMAGYEATAISLTWALIEIARHPDVQDALRIELQRELADEYPTYEKLVNGLPYLEAFTCEMLRLHSPAPAVHRVAHEDDIVPLSQPIQTASGEIIDSVSIAKGTRIRIPIAGIHTSETLWGENALKFDPGRWIEESVDGDGTLVPKTAVKGLAEQMQGYKHLISFAYGPRTCIGKTFALIKFKAVLSVLVRNFSFELPNGQATEIGSHRSILPRPKVVGEEGPRVPLVVTKIA